MMVKLKVISKDAIPNAFERAERYRLMNEPMAAESICLDILEVDPENQKALVTLLLALSEQFDQKLNLAFNQTQKLLSRIHDEYNKAFYSGIVCERRAKAHLTSGILGAGSMAYGWFHEAMRHYKAAIGIRPPQNDEAILRWNTCVRILLQNPEVRPKDDKEMEHMLE